MKANAKLQQNGMHRNIVTVLRQGCLGPPFDWSYIDMELCDMNLHDYIHSERPSSLLKHGNPVFIPNGPDPHSFMSNVWIVIFHITEGLEFIHRHGQIHRDIKPKNGTYF